MSAKRALVLVLGFVLAASLLVGCSAESQDATFIGYKTRPVDDNTAGIAIVQLESGEPAEASCTYTSLENGAAIRVEKNGDKYKVVSVSPDWK